MAKDKGHVPSSSDSLILQFGTILLIESLELHFFESMKFQSHHHKGMRVLFGYFSEIGHL